MAKFRELGEDAGQYDFVPFAVESYGSISYKPHSVQRQQRKIRTHISSNSTTAQPQNESYGRLGAAAQSLLKELGEVAAARGSISKAAFVKAPSAR